MNVCGCPTIHVPHADVTLTLDHTNITVREDQGTVNLTINKEGSAAVAVNVVVITRAEEALCE